MKRWAWYLLALAAVAIVGGRPFSGDDVARLQPVEVIQVHAFKSGIQVLTDTGDFGVGATLEEAFADLKKVSPGKIFLETAEYVLVTPGAEELLLELSEYLRAGCGVCQAEGEVDLREVARYFTVHPPKVTLGDCRAEGQSPQILLAQEGRMEFAEK